MIRVLVAEDSPTLRDFLVNILSAAADIQVIATATDGVHAVEAVRRLKPDVVRLKALVARPDGTAIVRIEEQAATGDAARLGAEAGRRIKADMPPDFFIAAELSR